MKLSRDLLSSVYAKTDGRCWYCGNVVPPFSNWQIDHQLPVSRGGTDDITNLVPSCRGCNARKNNKTVEEYRQAIVFRIARAIGVAIETAETVEGSIFWPDNEPPESLSAIISALTVLANKTLTIRHPFYGEVELETLPILTPIQVAETEA